VPPGVPVLIKTQIEERKKKSYLGPWVIVSDDFSYRKWHPTRHNMHLSFCHMNAFIMHYAWYIIHYTLCIMHHALYNIHCALCRIKFIKNKCNIVSYYFYHCKLHLTWHNLHLFLYASIWVHVSLSCVLWQFHCMVFWKQSVASLQTGWAEQTPRISVWVRQSTRIKGHNSRAGTS
jgi:hypothetical protein